MLLEVMTGMQRQHRRLHWTPSPMVVATGRDEDVGMSLHRFTRREVGAVIRVLVVDDHPTMRAGLHVCLRGEPGLVPVGAADSADTAMAAARSLRPDVVLLDLHLPGGGGLHVTRLLKAEPRPPRVLIFTAFADDALLVPALIAGADGVLGKEAGSEILIETIRKVHAEGCVLAPPNLRQLHAAMASLEAEEHSIVAMLLAGVSVPEIAATLRVDPDVLDERLGHMLFRLQP